MRRFAFIVWLAIGALASPAAAQTVNKPAGFSGIGVGVYQASVGLGAWTDVDGGDFDSLTGTTLAATHKFVSVCIENTHATQTLYVLLKANAAEAPGAAQDFAAGDKACFEGLISAAAGAGVMVLSLQGSGAATTARINAYFR